jgi:PAS domain S-box-containing protein
MKTPFTPAFSGLDNSTEFLCGITDTELRFLHSNAFFKKQFGLIKDEYKGRPFHEVVQSFQIDKFIKARETCINNPNKVIIIEIKSYQEKEEHWFRWEMSALTDDQKRITKISFIGTDITHQKKVEQELLKQAILLDNISDAIISTDLDLCIKSWNMSSEMLFGFKTDEVLNKPITDFFSLKTLYISNEEALETIFKKGFWKGEMIVKKKNGSKLFMRSAVSLIKNAKGEATELISVNQDISNEKKAKEELTIKKEEFHSFMENTAALAWINDENGTLYYMNSLYKKVFGLTDKAIGKNIFSCFPEEMTRGWKETDYEVLNNNARIDAVEKGTTPEGKDIYYQVYKFPVNTLSGKKLVGGQAINITEKKLSRMELEKQKNQFYSFMENTPALGWINDEEGKLHYMNSLFKKAFGLTDEVIGKNIFDFYPKAIKAACKASDELVLKTNASIETFEEGKDSEGKTIYYRVFKFPVHNQGGKRLIGGQAIDITSETISKMELLKEKGQFISFMENAPLLAWIVDEKGITRYMNSMYKESSYFTDENLNKDNHDLYPEAIRKKARQSIKEVLENNQTIKYQYSYVDESGKARYFNTSKFPIHDLEGNAYVGGQSIEVTELIEANLQMTNEKNRFQSFMENAPQLAWVVDENETLQYMNDRFKTAFNLSNEDIGEKITKKNAPDATGKALRINKEVILHNKAIEYLEEWTDPEGKIHYYRTYKFSMPAADGKCLIGAQSIDITNEVAANNDLEKMHERFEYASKATRDVIWDWDVLTNKIQRFGGSNAFFNFNNADDLMDFSNDNIHPDEAEEAEKSLQAALKSGASRWMSEFRYKAGPGTYKNVIDQAYIIRDETGRAIRLIGSMQDVTEERRLQKEVMDAEIKKKQDMINATLFAQETERKELSEELHDNVNQLLASALMFLKIAEKQSFTSSDANQLVGNSIEYVNMAITEIRNISHALNPGSLKHNGISAAINDMAEGLNIPGKFTVQFVADNIQESMISKDLQLAMYRIVQENINNILKHAGATEVFIRLFQQEGTIQLHIKDNGKGFDADIALKGLGLMNIFNRAESFGGNAKLITSPGNGCILEITIPLT